MGSVLQRYMTGHYLATFASVLALFLALTWLFDTVELLRRAGKTEAGLALPTVIEMSLLKLPQVGQRLIPFAILFSAMLCFWRLTRRHELVIVRACGISAWQFLLPILVMAVLLGVVSITMINPAGAVLLARYGQMERDHLDRRSSSANVVEKGGLWLRQSNGSPETFIHAERVDADTWELTDVQVHFVDPGGFRAVGRVDAASARLNDGAWLLRDAWVNDGETGARLEEQYRLPTHLTRQEIEDSFADPETLSFWQLPHFIQVMEQTGLPAVRLRMHHQALLAQPLLYAGLILIAASVSLQLPRRGNTLGMIGAGVVVGFLLFFVTDVVRALGLAGTIPIPLAAWAPAGLALLTGTAALLHLEDG